MKAIYLKIFAINFLLMLLVTSVKLFGGGEVGIVSPVGSADVFETLRPKLEQVRNTYKLTKDSYIFPQAGASATYSEAAGYAVVDFASGKIVEEKNLEEQLPIASITKVMTAVVALDLLSPEEQLGVSDTAANIEPTRAGFLPGETLTVEELLHALLLTSANDAAEILKEGTDKKYKSAVFIRAMNAKAEFLGLSQSHFQNPQGYDASTHYSSVRDVAVLTHYALTNYPLIAEIVRKDYMYLEPTSTHKQFDLYNWNGLIGVYPQTEGVKIGYTDAAEKTTVVVSNRAGRKMLAVVLGAPDIIKRDLWAAELLDIGYQKTERLEPIKVTEEMLLEKYASWKTWN